MKEVEEAKLDIKRHKHFTAYNDSHLRQLMRMSQQQSHSVNKAVMRTGNYYRTAIVDAVCAGTPSPVPSIMSPSFHQSTLSILLRVLEARALNRGRLV